MAAQTQTQQQAPADKPYKKQLDEAASRRTQDINAPTTIQKVVETVSEYIPAAAGPLWHLAGHQATPAKTKDAEAENVPEAQGQIPERPLHDEHIANFVREQHRRDPSKILEGEK